MAASARGWGGRHTARVDCARGWGGRRSWVAGRRTAAAPPAPGYDRAHGCRRGAVPRRRRHTHPAAGRPRGAAPAAAGSATARGHAPCCCTTTTRLRGCETPARCRTLPAAAAVLGPVFEGGGGLAAHHRKWGVPHVKNKGLTHTHTGDSELWGRGLPAQPD